MTQRTAGSRRPTAVSLFSGCGGSDAGLVGAGFDVVMANDNFAYAKDFYQANLPDTDYRLCDVAEIVSLPRADLLAGCYPCQGFSQGGARDPRRKLNYLYREFDRVLRKIKPKAFIVENVSGMSRRDFRHLLSNQVTRFRLAGYRVSYKTLDAKWYGVPQERQRIFIVGIRSNLGTTYSFPEPTHGTDRNPVRTIASAIGSLPTWPVGEFCQDPFHWYYLSRNRYRPWGQPSKTIVSKMRHMPLHPTSPLLVRVHTDKWVFEDDSPARRFSYREAALLQGFASDVVFPDTAPMSAKYRVVGNAVPPPLFRAVAASLPNVW
ncbi:MAG: DNA (cytosine-5-)-methyltransferase [Gammaproteobacteria bacterium]|nr:DNA (cytosine-5-)-methyltransferase [Gammaproteobacteria bacterium]